ncbi:S-crystallin SL11-like [Patiria miniata]|uniref:Glutathione transferase n=1 Tax=Patiria miniata TaxID=46514 RepID=A0A914AE48_PATMI|nr:S-crystallin SL11-like [Patiria miniata]XP_038062073.1 S-crystallin SL11-like [Patiria miniata]XP_038062074.1 S-crystallin SL11-like [Patiria miniata]
MPSYKLLYFDTRGRAEATRMLFAVANQEFEDVRITKEDWPKVKPTTPQGHIPVLVVDGKQLPQSAAIESFVAKELGLYGSNNWEAAQIDVVKETLKDLIDPMIMPVMFELDKAKQAENAKEYYENVAPPHLKNLQDLLEKNKDGIGYFVGDKVSLADVIFFVTMEWFEKPPYSTKGLKSFPKLVALKDRLATNDLAKHLRERPQVYWIHD